MTFSEWRVVMSINFNCFYSMLTDSCSIRSLAYLYFDKRKSWYCFVHTYRFFFTGRHLTSGPSVLFPLILTANQRDFFFPSFSCEFCFLLRLNDLISVVSSNTRIHLFLLASRISVTPMPHRARKHWLCFRAKEEKRMFLAVLTSFGGLTPVVL